MKELRKKLEAILEEEFPDTKTVRYSLSQPWDHKHIILVHRDWKRDISPWSASVAFDDRENLGRPDIKVRINAMIASCEDSRRTQGRARREY